MGITAKIERLRGERVEKAISHRPDLAGRTHLSSQYADTVGPILEAYADYAKVYEIYAWVHKAIQKTAEAIAGLQVRVVDADEDEVAGHPLTNVLAYCNDSMTPADLWQHWLVHMYLGGESFIEILPDARGRPAELWPRRPDRVLVRPDADPERKYYPRVADYVWGDDEVVIPAEEMIHDRFYNPLNIWRGLAPITAIREGVTIDLFAQSWSKLFLKRGARPDYALVTPQGLTRSEREELENTLMFKYSGPDNWHKPIVLEQGITDIKSFSFAPKDLEWLEQRRFARDEVAAIFGVPDIIMGYGPETYDTETKALAALKVFWTLTLIPLIQHRDISLTHHWTKVQPLLTPGQRLETDLSGVGVLQEDMTPKLEQAAKLWSLGVPFNTIDERLGLDIGPIPGGDIGWIPFSLTPIEQAAQPPEPVPPQLLPPAEQPEAEQPEEEPAPEEPEPEQRAYIANKEFAPYGSERHIARWKAFEAQRRPYELEFKRRLKRDFQDQQIRALRVLRDLWAEKWAKAMKRQTFTVSTDDLMDWQSENAALAKEYASLFETIAAAFGAAELANILELAGTSIGMEIVFDIGNPLFRDAVRQMAIKFANDINATTQEMMADELREILLESEEGGWSIPDIRNQIYDRISMVFDVRKSDYQTERIARTESLSAANQGSLAGMRQSGVVQKKEWLSAMDDRTRSPATGSEFDHVRAHGEQVPLEAFFERTGEAMEFPGDKRGSLGNFINCRCTVIPVIGRAENE